MEGNPSGGVYFTSPLVSLAAEARIAEIGVLFLGSPIPKLITASPRSRRSRASSFSAKVGDSAISLANLLNFIDAPLTPLSGKERRRAEVEKTKSGQRVP